MKGIERFDQILNTTIYKDIINTIIYCAALEGYTIQADLIKIKANGEYANDHGLHLKKDDHIRYNIFLTYDTNDQNYLGHSIIKNFKYIFKDGPKFDCYGNFMEALKELLDNI